jgi:peptidoglycan/LPS O-acetylase OafA/YrhL
LAILAVAANHSAARGFIAMFWWVHRYRPVAAPNFDQMGTLPYYGLVAVQQLAQFCIPAFLFISGFFIAYAARGNPPTLSWKVVRTRIANLLWPYLIWSVVFYGAAVLEGRVLGNDAGYSLAEFFERLLTGGVVPPYFFVPLLIQFYLLSPFMARLGKSRPRLLLAVFALLQLAITAVSYLRLFDIAVPETLKSSGWVFVHWAFFFPFGVVCGFHQRRFVQALSRYKRWLLVAVMVFAILSVVESEVLYQTTQDYGWARGHLKFSIFFFGLAFNLYFLAIDTRSLPFTRTVEQMGSRSYGIYLLHVPVQDLLGRIIYHIAPFLLAHQILYQPLLLVFSVGVPFALMAAVQKSPAKKYYHLLFG